MLRARTARDLKVASGQISPARLFSLLCVLKGPVNTGESFPCFVAERNSLAPACLLRLVFSLPSVASFSSFQLQKE